MWSYIHTDTWILHNKLLQTTNTCYPTYFWGSGTQEGLTLEVLARGLTRASGKTLSEAWLGQGSTPWRLTHTVRGGGLTSSPCGPSRGLPERPHRGRSVLGTWGSGPTTGDTLPWPGLRSQAPSLPPCSAGHTTHADVTLGGTCPRARRPTLGASWSLTTTVPLIWLHLISVYSPPFHVPLSLCSGLIFSNCFVISVFPSSRLEVTHSVPGLLVAA